jgi:hypothetical protein
VIFDEPEEPVFESKKSSIPKVRHESHVFKSLKENERVNVLATQQTFNKSLKVFEELFKKYELDE